MINQNIFSMRYFKLLVFVFVWSALASCSISPEPISYGKDQCDFCRMGVVDKAHSAQYVTKKGKQFKFDAIECLIREISDPSISTNDFAHVLVADYSNPGNLINASTATYIVCKKIKSPMGAYLSAFSDKEEAQKTIAKSGGDLYDWSGIQLKLQKK